MAQTLDTYHWMGLLTEWLGVVGLAWLVSHSARFRRPPLGFLYPRRDGIIALSLYAVILVFAIVFAIGSPPVFTEPLRLAPAPLHDLGQAGLVAALSVLPFLAALVYRKQPAKSIGWNGKLLVPGLQLGVALAFLTVFLRNRVWDVLTGVETPLLGLLPLVLIIGIAEETIFRGYIQLRLTWWLGKGPGIALTALLYTIWHLPFLLHGLAAETVLTVAGLTFVQGLVLGWVMEKSGHAFAPALYRAIAIWIIFLV